MRLALIAPGFAAERDWAIPVLRDLVRGLALRHDVIVFALRYPHRSGLEAVDGTPVRSFGGADARGLASVKLLVRATARIVADLRPRPPDLVHALWADEPGAVAVAAARLLRVPAIVSVLGGETVALPEAGYGGRLGHLNRTLLAFALRHAALVTVPSLHVRRSLARSRRGRPIAEVPLGVDPGRFHPGPAPEPGPLGSGGPRLLQVASLVPVKDQRLLLDAFALVRGRHPQATLHIVGDGPLREQLERRAREPGLAGSTTFHGRVPHERLPEYYRAADLYVQTSRHESQGMTVLEAAACGLPVVGTAVGVLPELPGARAVPAGNAAALATAILDRLAESTAATALPERYIMRRTLERLDAIYGAVTLGDVHRLDVDELADAEM